MPGETHQVGPGFHRRRDRRSSLANKRKRNYEHDVMNLIDLWSAQAADPTNDDPRLSSPMTQPDTPNVISIGDGVMVVDRSGGIAILLNKVARNDRLERTTRPAGGHYKEGVPVGARGSEA
jgi:hypothetical protein